jgi:hypothetical protein
MFSQTKHISINVDSSSLYVLENGMEREERDGNIQW